MSPELAKSATECMVRYANALGWTPLLQDDPVSYVLKKTESLAEQRGHEAGYYDCYKQFLAKDAIVGYYDPDYGEFELDVNCLEYPGSDCIQALVARPNKYAVDNIIDRYQRHRFSAPTGTFAADIKERDERDKAKRIWIDEPEDYNLLEAYDRGWYDRAQLSALVPKHLCEATVEVLLDASGLNKHLTKNSIEQHTALMNFIALVIQNAGVAKEAQRFVEKQQCSF